MARSNRFKGMVDRLIQIAQQLGVTAESLRGRVHEVLTGDVHPDNVRYQSMWELADSINKAGLRAQLFFLVEVLGYDQTLKEISGGSLLDGFVQQVDSEETVGHVEDDVKSVDEDGDPWE